MKSIRRIDPSSSTRAYVNPVSVQATRRSNQGARTDEQSATHVGEPGSGRRERITPVQILIPTAAALLICIVFLPASPRAGAYLLAISALTIGPAFALRAQGWRMGPLFLATPALVFSLDVFALRLGWFNIQEYVDGSWPFGLQQSSIEEAALLALLANLLFWLGFFSPVSRIVAARLMLKMRPRLQTHDGPPREWRMWLAFSFGIVTRLYLVKSGTGSFFSTSGTRADAASYTQFLVLIEGLTPCILALYLASLLKGYGLSRWRFGMMLAIEMTSVLLLGFKGQVVIRFLYLGVTYVLVKRRLPWTIALIGGAALIVIFPINLAVRAGFGNGQIQSGNLSSIQSGYLSAFTQTVSQGSPVELAGTTIQQIAFNSGQLEPFSMVVQYQQQTGITLGGAEYLSPVTSLIPRALWPSKPLTSLGGFVYNQVYGRAGNVSVGQTLPGDFYLNFGLVGLIVGFLLWGVIHRVLLPIVRETTSLRYLPAVVVLAYWLMFPNADFGPFLSGAMRSVAFSLVVLHILVPHARSGRHSARGTASPRRPLRAAGSSSSPGVPRNGVQS